MSDIAGIRFTEAGPVSYCSAGELALGIGDYVVVSTERGERLGWVVIAPDQVISGSPKGPLKVIERLATEADVSSWREGRRRAEEDHRRAQALAARSDSRVRVASVEYDLAGDFCEITFAAKERIEHAWFARQARELLGCDVRVEQVGDRDRAKAMGGLGVCGLALCCATWQTEFPSISIKMAKEQDLPPNPSKISGVCGRLLCCLSYEVESYRELRGDLPRVGKRVSTPIGNARVTSVNALTQLVRLRMESGQFIDIPADELRAQYGTAVRPADLEEEVEAPLKSRDQALRDALLARLTPVEAPAAEPAPLERAAPEESSRPEGTSGRRPGRGRGAGRSRDGARPARTSRRRPGEPRGPVAASEEGGGARAPDRAEPADGAGSPPSGEAADAGERRRRRRGRRGGRGRRRGAGGDGSGQQGGGGEG